MSDDNDFIDKAFDAGFMGVAIDAELLQLEMPMPKREPFADHTIAVCTNKSQSPPPKRRIILGDSHIYEAPPLADLDNFASNIFVSNLVDKDKWSIIFVLRGVGIDNVIRAWNMETSHWRH